MSEADAVTSFEATESVLGPRWCPLGAVERRVVGALAEKAKTTPDVYPLSLNALVTACNQKSNRHPLMQLTAEEVEESLERLRALRAAGIVEGHGRVPKFRHYLYEWLGVDKVELAVITELLLRGPQTLGDLRAHVARMEPIADLTALRTVVESLKQKQLVLSLTPEGRGRVVAHNLYPPNELERLRMEFAPGSGAAAGPTPPDAAMHQIGSGPPSRQPDSLAPFPNTRDGWERELQELRTAVGEIRQQMEDLLAHQQMIYDEVRQLRQDLGG